MKLTFTLTATLLIALSTVCAQAPYFEWAKRAGSNSHDQAFSVTTDLSGYVYTVGEFRSSSISFGSTTLNNTSLNYNDIFIVKSDSLGNMIWAKKAGGINNDDAYAVTTDPAGNIFVAGGFNSPTMTFGTITLNNAGGFDMFIAKYDSLGNVIWAKNSNGSGNNDAAYAIVADDSGNVFVAGGFNSPSFSIGTNILTNTGGFDVFLARYDASGGVAWAKNAGGVDDDVAQALALDTSGQVFIAGYFKSPSANFDTSVLYNTSTNQADMFVVRYDGSGNVHWAKSAGNNFDNRALAITTDVASNIYVSGYFSDSVITFGTTTLHNAGSIGLADIFVVKYDNSGNVLWARQQGGTSFDYGQSLTAGPSGSILLAGYFKSPVITFGTTTLNNTFGGYTDVFIAAYDTTGNVLWAKGTGGNNNDEAYSIITDTSGNIYLAGTFYSASVVFDSTTIINSGLADVFIAKISFDQSMEIHSSVTGDAHSLTIFPNPSVGEFIVRSTSEIGLVQVFNSYGQIVQTATGYGQNNITLQLPENGVYLVRITNEKQTVTQKVVVEKN